MSILRKITVLAASSVALFAMANVHAQAGFGGIEFEENDALPVAKCLQKCVSKYKACAVKAAKNHKKNTPRYKTEIRKCVDAEQKCQSKCSAAD